MLRIAVSTGDGVGILSFWEVEAKIKWDVQSWERGGNPGRSHHLEGDCTCYKSPLKFWQDSNTLLHSSSYFYPLFQHLSLRDSFCFPKPFFLLEQSARLCLIHSYPRNPWKPSPKFPLGQTPTLWLQGTSHCIKPAEGAEDQVSFLFFPWTK